MTKEEFLERIANGRTDLVWDYVAEGHAASAKTRDGVRLLQWCAHFGDVRAMRFLLDHGESLTAYGTNLGLTDCVSPSAFPAATVARRPCFWSTGRESPVADGSLFSSPLMR